MVASAVAVVVTVVAVVVVDVVLELMDVKNPPHVNIAEGELD